MEGLPPKKIVFAFGRFQPPTIGHELLVNTVKRIAGNSADHIIYASKTEDAKKNPLPVARKVYYLKRMFPGVNFAAANEQQRTFMEVATALNKKYKHIVMVAGSDRIAEYKRLLNTYNGKDFNFDSIEVISAGERDPDADDASGMSGTKMREAAKKGDFKLFKTGLPHTITDLDARRLMNEIRKASGLQPVKESLNIVVDDLREKYFRGEIFNVGDSVICNEETFEIVKRGSNHLLVKAEDGSLHSKWIQDVQIVENLTNKTLKSNDKIKVARVIATMLSVDNAESMSNPEQIVNAGLRKVRSKTLNKDSVAIVKRMLELADDVGIEYDSNLLQAKLKESLDMIKFKDYHLHGNKDHLRKMKRNYQLGEEEIEEGEVDEGAPYYNKPSFIKKMSAMAKRERMERERKEKEQQQQKPKNEEVEVDEGVQQTLRKYVPGYAKKQIDKKMDAEKFGRRDVDKDANYWRYKKVQDKLKKEDLDIPVLENEEMWAQRVIDEEEINNDALPLHADAQFPEGAEDFEEISDEEIDSMVNSMSDDDLIEHGYDDDEVVAIDADTGEEVEMDDEDKLKEAALMEVLSRLERIKARVRFKRTEAKRERRLSIALKKTSNTQTINKRARRLAIKTLKQRFARKPISKLSVAEKERLEQRIAKMKPVLNRIAMRMAPRVRKLERDRIRR